MTEQRVKGLGPLINTCEVPSPAKRDEAEIYAGIRDTLISTHCSHAARKSSEHRCAGKITITARHVTFQCPLCGDSRVTI